MDMTEDLQSKAGEYAEPGFEAEHGDNQRELIESLERLLRKLEDLEKQQAMDRKVIEQALERVKALGQQDPEQTAFSASPADFGENLVKWVKKVQSLARMVDTLAGSLLAVTETTAAVNRVHAAGGNASQLDLSGLMRVVAEFVQDLDR